MKEKYCRGCAKLSREEWTNGRTAILCTGRGLRGEGERVLTVVRSENTGYEYFQTRPAWCEKNKKEKRHGKEKG